MRRRRRPCPPEPGPSTSRRSNGDWRQTDRLDLVGPRQRHLPPDPPAPHQDAFVVLRPAQMPHVLAGSNHRPRHEERQDGCDAPAERPRPGDSSEAGRDQGRLHCAPEPARVHRLPHHRLPVEPRHDLIEKARQRRQGDQRREPLAIAMAALLRGCAARRLDANRGARQPPVQRPLADGDGLHPPDRDGSGDTGEQAKLDPQVLTDPRETEVVQAVGRPRPSR